MTPPDLDALNQRIFTTLGWWKSGQVCGGPFVGGHCCNCDVLIPTQHWREDDRCQLPVPSPNIMEWAVFGRVLMCLLLTYKVEFWQHNTGCFHVTISPRDNSRGSKWQNGDSPQLALALAIDQMRAS